MLLIHVPRLSNRLGYTLNVLFHHLLRTDFSITTDPDCFAAHSGPKLCYGPHHLEGGIYLKSVPLLFSTSIEEQNHRATQQDGQWQLFPVYGGDSDLPFDPLAASFFMLSRYEEYLPYRTDPHGRFPAEQSIAYRHGFLRQPVVEQWAALLRSLLHSRYPNLRLPQPTYSLVQTFDIDEAWCYLHKGLVRTLAGTARNLFLQHDPAAVRQRIRVLRHRAPDPYDTFAHILSLHRRYPASRLFFFALVADYGQFDKPISHLNPHMRDLLQSLADHATLGIHPGYSTLDKPADCDLEIARLQSILHRDIHHSRFHFLRLHLPHSYRILLHAGIRHDHSMAFPDAPGFRAGTSSPFPFFDLLRDQETDLLIHPFCLMDTTLRRYLHLAPAEALPLCRELVDSVRAVGGAFTTLFHNQNLADTEPWQGWRTLYEQIFAYAQPH
ncbi:MAG: polysaccharide deacetylase family protein [Bacteroidales bacterium]|nr:polysaccharide deacetylase family protein [Bacteroidales bacterium]